MKNSQPHKKEDDNWKGYTLDELRYQRAFALAHLEIEKERITSGLKQMYQSSPMGSGKGLVSKMIGGLNYVDYAVLAFRFGKRIYRIFKKKR